MKLSFKNRDFGPQLNGSKNIESLLQKAFPKAIIKNFEKLIAWCGLICIISMKKLVKQ